MCVYTLKATDRFSLQNSFHTTLKIMFVFIGTIAFAMKFVFFMYEALSGPRVCFTLDFTLLCSSLNVYIISKRKGRQTKGGKNGSSFPDILGWTVPCSFLHSLM